MNKILIETSWSFATKIITMILFFGINIFLARKIGVELFWVWSFLFSFVTIVSIISFFWLNLSIKKFTAEYNETENLKSLIKGWLTLRVIISFIFVLVMFFLYKPIVYIIWKPELEVLFLYSIPLIFLSGMVEFLKYIFMWLHRIKYNFIINLFEYWLKLLLIILFFSFSISITSIISSFIWAMFITTIVWIYLLYMNFYKDLIWNNKDFKKDILNYSYPFIIIAIWFIAITEIDTFMLGIMSTNEEVWFYAVAKSIILYAPHITTAIAMWIMPIFAKMNDENKKELKKKLIKLIKFNSLLFTFIVLWIVFLSPYLIPFIFWIEYIWAVLPLQILSIYLFLYANSVILNDFLDYTWKNKKRAYYMLLILVLSIILNYILIPKYWAVWASIWTSISYSIYFLLNSIEVKRTISSVFK